MESYSGVSGPIVSSCTAMENTTTMYGMTCLQEYRATVTVTFGSKDCEGNGIGLPDQQRAVLWSIFEVVRAGLNQRNLITHPSLLSTLAAALAKTKKSPFDFVVVDEAQDISIAHERFFAALGQDRPNALFFAGDLGQRIFQQPLSWKGHAVDVRGRFRTLRVNYRTSHQIRLQEDRLPTPK